ncbi:hypothetical protein D1815_18720 [Aquimarina sp. AD1]|uniref:hypothetical protein n=1 Tax=Aquimarina sp. (strain AD1) TaxID=1714848 RepID=UPI000E4B2CBA|nr:hypothetical protein [Aquimarina sp. AD1]AXT57683.1 hypothetical protein D1815_18720 [Aquimarina sp. AD1]RKN34325.1 hypothetical protein D7035_04435 [Aquimarina sp. AD1]
MKTKFKSISVIVMMAIAIMFQSCSSEDDGVIIENEDQLENIQGRIEQYQESIENIEAPDDMEQYAQQNTYASSAVFTLSTLQVQALAYSSVFLSIPGDAEQQSIIGKNGRNTRTWVWSYGGVTLYYTVTSDATYDYFTYDIEESGVRRTFYEGKISKDGNFYDVRFNGEGGDFVLMTFSETGSIINFSIKDQSDNGIELVYNEVDQSGSIKAFELGVLTESFVWLSDGTGTYTNHATGETFSWP